MTIQFSTNLDSMLSRTQFGINSEGKSVDLFTIINSKGMKVQITNFGGKVVSLFAPDRNGVIADVVLGYSTFPEWERGNPYFGAIIGRYANRIANGVFTIDGIAFQLNKNNGPNSLHGGPEFGFHNVLWSVEEIHDDGNIRGITLYYSSPDGEEGFPGKLDVRVTYLINDDNELRIKYFAKTDKATPVNLTHHSFFNLCGEGKGDILGHKLIINAEKFTPVDSNLIPTGELASAIGTPFDFTSFRAIGERIGQKDTQIEYGNGYDHNFAIRISDKNDEMKLAAIVVEPKHGRRMEVSTTEPGLQFYSGNFLDGSDVGKSGIAYKSRSAFCLETQHFPDSPNRSNFPSTILRPGEIFNSETIYRFSVE
jgi:aldose 1-epimerase